MPDHVIFATKPELARGMLARALAAGAPAAWTTADEVYGGNPSLRAWLETHRMPSVLAIRCTESLQPRSGAPMAATALAAGVPPQRWLRINAGDGAKGKRWYAWTRVQLAADGAPAGWMGPLAAGPPQPLDRGVGLLRVCRPGSHLWPSW